MLLLRSELSITVWARFEVRLACIHYINDYFSFVCVLSAEGSVQKKLHARWYSTQAEKLAGVKGV